jgi:Ser/Thr protein kinase RdoA (MazF antagonist)
MNQKPNIKQMSLGLSTEIVDIQAYRNYWMIIGEKEKWIAKPFPDSQHSIWWGDIEQELRKRGFHSFPKTKQIGTWLLSLFIEGTMISYKEKTHLFALMQLLAQFHQKGQYLETPPIKQVAYLLSDRLYDRLDHFYHLLVRPKRTNASRIVQLLHYMGPRFYHHAYEAYQKLCRNGLITYGEASSRHHMLCHRDLASHNWVLDKRENPWMIDFETASYDLQIGDVWQICSRILCEHQWDVPLCKQLIQSYEVVKPLASWEKQILATLFLFHNEFLRETIGILEKKSGYKEEQTIPYLEKMAFDYPIWLQRVGQIRIWLNK